MPVPPVDLEAIVKEEILKHENRSQVVVCGVPEGGDDASYVNRLLKHLAVEGGEVTEVYRLGQRQPDLSPDQADPSSDSPSYRRPDRQRSRLLKVRLTRAAQRDRVLASASRLKDDTKFPVFIRPSYTLRERQMIGELYDCKREMESKEGRPYYIKRFGSVAQWSVLPVTFRINAPRRPRAPFHPRTAAPILEQE